MTVIDLGFADTDPVSGTGRHWNRPSLRRLTLGAVLLLCLGTLTDSVVPHPRALRTLWTRPDVNGGFATAVGDSLVTLGRGDPRRITSYGLVDGRLRWSRQMPAAVPYLDAVRDSKVLLVPIDEVTRRSGDYDQTFFSRTVALDPATGAELWRSDGLSQGWTTPELTLLQRLDATGDTVVELIAVRLSDGARLWDHDVEGVTQLLPLHADLARAQRIAIVAGDEVTMLRLADGAEVGRGTVEATAGDPETGNLDLVYGDEDAVYVLKSAPVSLSATAYSTTTLQQLWRFELSGGGGGIYPCGPVLCVARSTELDGYDWKTGRLRWQAPGMVDGNVIDHGLLIASNGTGYAIAMDPATGRRIATLGAGAPLLGGDRLVTPDAIGRPAPPQCGDRLRPGDRRGLPARHDRGRLRLELPGGRPADRLQ